MGKGNRGAQLLDFQHKHFEKSFLWNLNIKKSNSNLMWGRSGLQGRKGKRPAAGNPLLSHPRAGCAPGETLLFDVKEAGILLNFIFQHSDIWEVQSLYPFSMHRLHLGTPLPAFSYF